MQNEKKVYLVVGGGAREHAIVLKLLESKSCSKMYVAPGNPGIYLSDPHRVKLIEIEAGDVGTIEQWCIKHKPDLVIVGPEDPLNKGLADKLKRVGILCFGPSQAASQIECDKSFAKDFMVRHEIPTAKYKTFTNSTEAKKYIETEPGFEHGYVVKASGLAAGKGVIIAKSKEDASACVVNCIDNALFGEAGKVIVVEEFIDGEECSVMAFSDGKTISVMPAAQDHKRLYNGDNGPNTGGMGSVCPFDLVAKDAALQDKINSEVIEKCIKGLADEGKPFVGVLFAGVMITADKDIYVLEYNCRFGDPETQSVLPLLTTSLADILDACVRQTLESLRIIWSAEPYLCGIVIASAEYPNKSTNGRLIEALPHPTRPDQFSNPTESSAPFIIHAGTKFSGAVTTSPDIVTNGGRILTVVGLGADVRGAQRHALEQAAKIMIKESRFRTDIGHRCIKRAEANLGLTYKLSGVDIDRGNRFVDYIKDIVKTTHRPGVMSQIGSFGALFDLKQTNLIDPVIVSGTDGVGTKLKLALDTGNCATVGIDLVAMCVNDILVHGAEPLFFLDYYACSRLNLELGKQIVGGIVDGCRLAGCGLIGGETAEMPGLYHGQDIDLAGFAVGAVERSKMLPRIHELKAGDVVIGLSSSGIHSNGFSLIRQLLKMKHLDARSIKCPFDEPTDDQTFESFAQCLLAPTTIYFNQLKPVIGSGHAKALAHITGGGLVENIPRCLPENLRARLDARQWQMPPVFGWIKKAGEVDAEEMLRTFNCGIGMVCIVDASSVDKVLDQLNSSSDSKAYKIGVIESRTWAHDPQCVIDNLNATFDECVKMVHEDSELTSYHHHGHHHNHHHSSHHHGEEQFVYGGSRYGPHYRNRHHNRRWHSHGHWNDHEHRHDGNGCGHRHEPGHHGPGHHSHEHHGPVHHGLGHHELHHHGFGHHGSHHHSPDRHGPDHHGPHHHSPDRHGPGHHGPHHHSPDRHGPGHHGSHHHSPDRHGPGHHGPHHHGQNHHKSPRGLHLERNATRRIFELKKKVAILISGVGTNAKAIIEYERQNGPYCPYKVELVISNKSDAPGLEMAKSLHVPTAVVSHSDFSERKDFDMAMDKILRQHEIEIICLAGFMRVLSNEFAQLWSGKLINIHPSLLPSFKGMHAQKQALDSGVRITGCTVHFVNAGVDEGAILMQESIDIKPDDTVESLIERGKHVENHVYPQAVSLLAQGLVEYDVVSNKTKFLSTSV